MVIFALSVTALLAVSGLILDGGMIYFEKRRMQAAVDAGAYGGSHELRRNNRDLATQIRPAVVYDTGMNGYTDANSTITVNVPPTSGLAVGDSNFLEVSIEKSVPTYLLRMLGPTSSTVRARAVAGVRAEPEACIIALDPTARDALKTNGNPTLNANCGVMVNSNDPYAFRTPGGGCVTASWVGVTGGYSANCVSPTPMTGVPPIVDPLVGLDPPEYASMASGSSTKTGDLTTYTPGYYQNQIKITGNEHLFMPGTYVLNKGLKATGGSIEGEGVFFYNIGGGNSYIEISASTSAHLEAPTSGPMKGVLFYTNRYASSTGSGNKISRGSGNSCFVGALYFPSQHLDFAGNPYSEAGWTLIIANTIDISGTADVQVVNPPAENAPPAYTSLMLE